MISHSNLVVIFFKKGPERNNATTSFFSCLKRSKTLFWFFFFAWFNLFYELLIGRKTFPPICKYFFQDIFQAINLELSN